MKSWISKALLGLCLTAPAAMALLPTLPGRYAGIRLRTNGFSNSQIQAIKTSFGMYSILLTQDLSSGAGTNYRIVSASGDPDQVAIITFNLIHGSVPNSTACSAKPDYQCHNFTISGPSSPNIVVNFYDRVIRTSSAGGDVVWKNGYDSLTFQNVNLFQNMMTELFGRIFFPSYNGGPGGPDNREVAYGIALGKAANGPAYTSFVVPPYFLGFGYGATGEDYGSNYSSAVGLFEFKVMNAAGTDVVGKRYITSDRIGQNFPGINQNMQLVSTRYLVNNSTWNDPNARKLNFPASAGRIAAFDINGIGLPACYNVTASGSYYFTSGDPQNTPGPDLQSLANGGLRFQNLIRSQQSYGDDLVNPANGGNCTTGIGYVGDVLQ